MDNIKLTRVDFRLIHGQVMTRWVVNLGINKIIVIDDHSAKNPIFTKILVNAATEGVEVKVFDQDKAVEQWNEDHFGDGNILLLFKDIETAKSVWEKGIKFTELQIGGIGGAAGRKNVYKNIVISKEDYDRLKVLHSEGVNVYMQPIPEDKPYPFASIIEKKLFD
ncbi:PTS system mannose/fructose/N-acetylgalactosamine-transporter subunit IIB [Tepidimicrobium xylanilyticum]|uniref:PTS system mannose/fructose/N-acetylgalactosamine-transporter subunit IIB n=1 Tax=Tepidimicrobium xylanilyticum TaxID=1123352 RepID=UPI00264CA97D|nr:PTS sugar transporter subunit IIB [Tepidimicrobium xylanilyticum]GMG95353.1 PTS sugar transporter subunit IIB [Tepidimicrobium xylanilyticum]